MAAEKPEDGWAKSYRRQVVRLAEVVPPGAPSLIRDTLFEDCDIYGPAVVATVETVAFDNVTFDAPPDLLFIEASMDRGYVGVIGVSNVRFERCRFHNVGWLVQRDLMDRLYAALARSGTGS